ncbi:MAG: hypothetical protein MUF87_05565 [Anaerolineae bacterium]|jgi:hypothetical protein|nr:hypothetical protein [Anaerolineae bacterium]
MSQVSPSVAARPGRPLGLSLAILSTVFVFSLLPLTRLGLDLLIENHIRNLDWSLDLGGERYDPYFAGGEVDVVSDQRLLTEVTLGGLFLMIAIMAWIGRPKWIRWMLFAWILGLGSVYALLLLSALLTPTGIDQSLDSAANLVRSSQIGYLLTIVLVCVYSVWYMNRAPARAFYRGYYLPSELGADTFSPAPDQSV